MEAVIEHTCSTHRSRYTLNLYNRPAPPDIPPPSELLDVNTDPPSEAEIAKAIKSLKSGKAAGPDGIPPDALKVDIQTSTDMLHPLLSKIWEQEKVPENWKKGHLVNWAVSLSPKIFLVVVDWVKNLSTAEKRRVFSEPS